MPQKLLLIDDSESIHALVRHRLSHESVEIFSALDGTSGLALAASLRPDVILLDVDMPGIDGFEVCRRLKTTPATSTTPIIFLTGSDSSEKKIEGLEIGAADYITKPFDPAELRARVRASLRTAYLLDLLSRKAMIDGLTGLWNRAYLDSRLASEISLSHRTGQPLSCVMMDLDHFKAVNDRFGHQFGDEALKMVSAILGSLCRAEDVVCRYGGEEFSILLPNTTCERATELAERLRQAIAEHKLYHHQAILHLTCSFGVADLQANVPPSMLEMADQALYQAKHGGRNRVSTVATCVTNKAA